MNDLPFVGQIQQIKGSISMIDPVKELSKRGLLAEAGGFQGWLSGNSLLGCSLLDPQSKANHVTYCNLICRYCPEIVDLAKSIQKYGQFSPIVINQDGKIIIGQRRFLALIFLKKHLAQFRKITTSDGAAALMSVSESINNNNRLTIIEKAKIFLKLRDEYTIRDLANLLLYPLQNIQDALQMLRLPEVWQDKLDNGEITQQTAWKYLKTDWSNLPEVWKDKLDNGEISMKKARSYMEEVKKPLTETEVYDKLTEFLSYERNAEIYDTLISNCDSLEELRTMKIKMERALENLNSYWDELTGIVPTPVEIRKMIQDSETWAKNNPGAANRADEIASLSLKINANEMLLLKHLEKNGPQKNEDISRRPGCRALGHLEKIYQVIKFDSDEKTWQLTKLGRELVKHAP